MAYRTPPLLPPTAIVSLIVLISAYNIVNTINPVNQPKSATEQSELVSKIKSESCLACWSVRVVTCCTESSFGVAATRG